MALTLRESQARKAYAHIIFVRPSEVPESDTAEYHDYHAVIVIAITITTMFKVLRQNAKFLPQMRVRWDIPLATVHESAQGNCAFLVPLKKEWSSCSGHHTQPAYLAFIVCLVPALIQPQQFHTSRFGSPAE